MVTLLTDKGEFEILKEAYAGKEIRVGLYNESGTRGPAYGGEEADNEVSVREGSTVNTVSNTEPDRSGSYSRQTKFVDVSNIRRDAGFKLSNDLSAKVLVPNVVFDVSDATRDVNAVFVVFGETGSLHFTCFLDETYDLSEIDDELTVTNIELYIE